MEVKATRLGYYGLRRRRPGETFTIADEKDFSNKWMEKVEPEEKAVEKKPRKGEDKPVPPLKTVI